MTRAVRSWIKNPYNLTSKIEFLKETTTTKHIYARTNIKPATFSCHCTPFCFALSLRLHGHEKNWGNKNYILFLGRPYFFSLRFCSMIFTSNWGDKVRQNYEFCFYPLWCIIRARKASVQTLHSKQFSQFSISF